MITEGLQNYRVEVETFNIVKDFLQFDSIPNANGDSRKSEDGNLTGQL